MEVNLRGNVPVPPSPRRSGHTLLRRRGQLSDPSRPPESRRTAGPVICPETGASRRPRRSARCPSLKSSNPGLRTKSQEKRTVRRSPRDPNMTGKRLRGGKFADCLEYAKPPRIQGSQWYLFHVRNIASECCPRHTRDPVAHVCVLKLWRSDWLI